MSNVYADIIINISHEAVDKVFQYQVPESLLEQIEIGMQVLVPFGKANKEQTGYIVRLSHKANYDENKMKRIIRVVEGSIAIESQLIKLAYWIKNQYGSTMINALKTVLPVKDKMRAKEQKAVKLILPREDWDQILSSYINKNYVAKARLLESLIKDPNLSYETITKQLAISKSTIDSMVKQQVIEVTSKQIYRNPVKSITNTNRPNILNEDQQKIIDDFRGDYEAGNYKNYLLHGVTGSGKTEVYMEAISTVLDKGKQAIVLIPEIALTFQTVNRFLNRFGNRVTIINSRMSKGERYDQFLRARSNEIDIVIGPRSALFAPFLNLGLIIIDEEHEATYKSDNAPKYHARETAIERARMSNASVILGSATPSLESYTKALLGEYVLWEIKERANKSNLPKVHIVDLRQELKSGNRSMFSINLRDLIIDRLQKKQQIMLFINRRGYANFISCRSCGHVMKCPHCDISLTYHNNNSLQCHYCGFTKPVPDLCPECKSKYIARFGTGTQKVEEAVKTEFPTARVLRMDMDTTKGKKGHEDILAAFSNHRADILVGTQMIVKGHDFDNVTLVGIMAADLSLFSNDFRAGERTFQLLTQAAGRAGRGKVAGEVVIQTYSPDHYSIIAASRQNYLEFYEQEISYRRILKYPPVYQMLVILITSADEMQGIHASTALFEAMNQKDTGKELVVIGPSEAAFSRINDIYRRVIYVKHLSYPLLINVKNFLEGYIDYSDIFKQCTILFDFNPLNTY